MGFWDDAEIIHVYTRAQAIADGVLVDVSDRGNVFAYPVAMTATAYAATVAWSDEDEARKSEGTGQSESGRIWDVFYLGAMAARRANGRQLVPFRVLCVPREGASIEPVPVDLHLHIGPGDTASPVLTIMLPGED